MTSNVDVNYELNRIKEQTNCLVDEIGMLNLKIGILEAIIDKGGLHQASKNEELIYMSDLHSNAEFHKETIYSFCNKIKGKLDDEARVSKDNTG